MKNIPGSMGTCASIALRLGQAMLFRIYFVHVLRSRILQLYSLLDSEPKRPVSMYLQTQMLEVTINVLTLSISVLSILTLAAASSTASIVDLLLKADVSFCPPRICSRYQISAAMAFLSWVLP
ncbi:UNVERIFIED_CONTAM: CASP-like protein 5C1 [Sesamum angustifolium]|uniref:CASP-like protein n=1 Tax=Sesamum angustifolium TaxID=2727405 RepID=A0AAW2P142_9LAMI